jgi:phospholipase/carboxylesterase
MADARGAALALSLALTPALGSACAAVPGPEVSLREGVPPPSVRLQARPQATSTTLAPGLHALGLARRRDGLLWVPEEARRGPVPLVVMLHGAGSSSRNAWGALRQEAEARGVAVLLPESRTWSWSFRAGSSEPDRSFLDEALARTFERVAVDPRRVALAGFSAGGFVALSLGPSNGDLFSWVAAFSPTGVVITGRVGRPRFFVSHGTLDDVVAISRSSRAIVPALRAAGDYVVYREFEGTHAILPQSMQEFFSLLLRG